MAAESRLVIEIFALLFWSFQLAPQAVENWQRKSTAGLSPLMMFSWTLGSLCTAVYNIGGSVGGKYEYLFIAQPNLFMVFSIVCWAQCTVYQQNVTKGILYGIALTAILTVVEVVGGYVTLQSSASWPFTLLGSMSLVFFAVGFLPQFYKIYLTRRVEGISLLFLAIDMLGSVFSITALALQTNFDPISGACYIVAFVCDLLIVVLHFCLPVVYPSIGSYGDVEVHLGDDCHA